MLQKWRAHGALTFAGYILGFPADTKESILRDIEIIKRELPLDILEFFFLTPLPGSEDHKNMLEKGVWMDPDINKYDLNHRVVASFEDDRRRSGRTPTGRRGRRIYTPDHIRTILKRAAQIPNGRPKPIASTIMWFKLMIDHEGVHPLEGGAFRLKYRRDRRRSLSWNRRSSSIRATGAGSRSRRGNISRFFLRTRRILKEVLNAPDRYDLQRPRHRAAARRRIRAAVALSRHQRRRGGARAQGARRQHSRIPRPRLAVAISATAAE